MAFFVPRATCRGMSATKRLTERVSAPFSGCRVDRAAGVIYGVKLSGFVSENGRDYPPDVYRRRIARYDGAPINFNHARERTVEGVGGKVRNPRVEEDGTPRGDAHLLKAHPLYGAVMEAAESEAAGGGGGLFGFSHVILAKTDRRGGRDVVEDIEAVESVDIVANPATTNGFFESKGGGVFTFKQLAEWVTRHPKSTTKQIGRAKKLAEDMDAAGMGDAPVMDAPPADDADPDTTITEALKQAGHDAWDACVAGSMTFQELTSKLKDILKDHGKYSGDKDAPAGGGTDTTPAAESTQSDPFKLIRECRELCEAEGFKASLGDLELLAHLPPAARRQYVTEQRAKTPAETPRSTTRAARTTEQRKPGVDGLLEAITG